MKQGEFMRRIRDCPLCSKPIKKRETTKIISRLIKGSLPHVLDRIERTIHIRCISEVKPPWRLF